MSSDDEEENIEEILLYQPSFSIGNNNEDTSACHIISKQLETFYGMTITFHKMILHCQQSTNSTYSIQGI
jgi:hypothetical protein